MKFKDISGNTVNIGDSVAFTDYSGGLLLGNIEKFGKYVIGVMKKNSKKDITFWRKGNEVSKIIYEEKIYITPYMFPVGQEPKAKIHEDDGKGTYYLKSELDSQSIDFLEEEELQIILDSPKSKKKRKDNISPRRIQNIINATPGIKWDINSIKITERGWGDRPAFLLTGYIKEPINGKVIVIKWHTCMPGGSYSRFLFDYKGKTKVIKAFQHEAQKVLDKIIKLLKEEKSS